MIQQVIKFLVILLKQGDNANASKLNKELVKLCCHIKLELHDESKEFYECALELMKQIGDRKGEAVSYAGLGKLYRSHKEYLEAREYYEKALEIRKEIGESRRSSRLWSSRDCVLLSW